MCRVLETVDMVAVQGMQLRRLPTAEQVQKLRQIFLEGARDYAADQMRPEVAPLTAARDAIASLGRRIATNQFIYLIQQAVWCISGTGREFVGEWRRSLQGHRRRGVLETGLSS